MRPSEPPCPQRRKAHLQIVNKLDGKEIGRQVVNYHNGIVKQTGTSPLLV
ncbi:MAG: hypothetical protein ACLVC2_08985 [Emergencia timonensis]